MDDSELRCSNCLEFFDLEEKVPKVLHEHCSYCINCLKSFPVDESTIVCPDCHVKVKLDEKGINGLEENSLLIPLIKMYRSKTPEAKSTMKESTKQSAPLPDWCLDCNGPPEHACRIIHDVLPMNRAKTRISQLLEVQKNDCVTELTHTARIMADIRKARDTVLLSVQAIEAQLLEASKNTLAKIEDLKEKTKMVEEFASDDFQEMVKLGQEIEKIKLDNTLDLKEAHRIGNIYRTIMETEAQITFPPLMAGPTLSIPMHISSTTHRSQIYKNLITLGCLQEIVDNNMMGVTKKDINKLYNERIGGRKVEDETDENEENPTKRGGLLFVEEVIEVSPEVNGSCEESTTKDEQSSESDNEKTESPAKIEEVKEKKTGDQKKNKKKNKGKDKKHAQSSLSLGAPPGAYKPREQANFLYSDKPYSDVFPSTFAGYPPAGMANPQLAVARGRGRALFRGGLVNNHCSTFPLAEASNRGYGSHPGRGIGRGQGQLSSNHSKPRQPTLSRNPNSKVRVFLDINVDGKLFGTVLFVLDKVAAPRMVENFVALCTSPRYPTYRHSRIVSNYPLRYILAGEIVKDQTFSSFGGLFEADASPLPDCVGAVRMKCVKKENEKVMVANLFSIWVGMQKEEFKRFPSTTVFGHVMEDGMDTIRRLSRVDSWKADIRITNCGLA